MAFIACTHCSKFQLVRSLWPFFPCLYSCLSLCLPEIFLLWTVEFEQMGQLCLAAVSLASLPETKDAAGQGTRLVMDSTHSQTLVVLCGQRLTSGRCLFMRAVNTGSGWLYGKTHTHIYTHNSGKHTAVHTHHAHAAGKPRVCWMDF